MGCACAVSGAVLAGGGGWRAKRKLALRRLVLVGRRLLSAGRRARRGGLRRAGACRAVRALACRAARLAMHGVDRERLEAMAA